MDSPDVEPPLSPEIDPEIMARLQLAVDRAVAGLRDPEAMRAAAASTDRIREQIFREHVPLDIGVPTLRELRGYE